MIHIIELIDWRSVLIAGTWWPIVGMVFRLDRFYPYWLFVGLITPMIVILWSAKAVFAGAEPGKIEIISYILYSVALFTWGYAIYIARTQGRSPLSLLDLLRPRRRRRISRSKLNNILKSK